MEVIEITVYDIVKACCSENGIKIKKLEEELGLANGTISKWETASPTLKNIAKIANYFQKPVDYFIPTET